MGTLEGRLRDRAPRTCVLVSDQALRSAVIAGRTDWECGLSGGRVPVDGCLPRRSRTWWRGWPGGGPRSDRAGGARRTARCVTTELGMPRPRRPFPGAACCSSSGAPTRWRRLRSACPRRVRGIGCPAPGPAGLGIARAAVSNFPERQTRLASYTNPSHGALGRQGRRYPCWVRRLQGERFQVFAINARTSDARCGGSRSRGSSCVLPRRRVLPGRPPRLRSPPRPLYQYEHRIRTDSSGAGGQIPTLSEAV